jgi:hypothetical protein
MDLICKHFANNNSVPMFPYVKVIWIWQVFSDKWISGSNDAWI